MAGGDSSFGQHGSGGGFHSNHGSCGPSSFSNEGSSCAFGPKTETQYRNDNLWVPVYDTAPVITHNHRRIRSHKSKCFSWSLTASIATLIVGLLWMLFGFYGSEHLEMGLNYSRLLTANRLFVQGISVQNRELAPGPRLYVFQNPPKLDDEKEWSVDHYITIPGFYHKEWALWLNRKSKVKLEYNVNSASSLFLVIAQGKKNYNEWIQDTGNPEWCLLWRAVHGHGHINFETMEDDEYYFGIANIHPMSMQMVLKMDIKAKVYDREEADSWCRLDVRQCTVGLSLKGAEVGLVTTPDKPQEGLDVWYAIVSYHTRWSTYIVIYGVLGLIILLIFSCRLKSKRSEFYHEVVPFESETEPAIYYGSTPAMGNFCPHDGMHTVNSSEVDKTLVEIPDENVCTICFEEQKNSFFQPCGHCATCYNCGLRVKEMSSVCPICRQPIQDVRKIYIT